MPARFEVLSELGRGGMSVVYRARDSQHDREVAVKVLKQAGAHVDRFRREATKLAALSHPNVVAFLELGEFQGRDYLVMEYVGQGNLSDYIKSRKPSLAELLGTFAAICSGLEHIHRKGIVHRDVKPENILVAGDGQPKITDLGVARQMERQTRLTQAGTILGTYAYLAPEQILSSDVTPSADLYSLGICLFEALTGERPFQAGNEYELLRSHVEESPPRMSHFRQDVPASLDALVDRLLKKSPEQRPRSAQEVKESLEAILSEISESKLSSVFLGRSEELERLLDLAGRLAQGSGLSGMLAAAGGAGRTRLLQEVEARLRGGPIGLIRLLPGTRPQKTLGGLCSALSLPRDQAWEVLRGQGASGLAERLRERLAALPGPTLLLIDDAERADATTRAVVRRLVAEPAPPGKGWILSVNQARAGDFTCPPETIEVDLDPLNDFVVLCAARDALGHDPSPRLTDWLLARSGGSIRSLRLNLLALQGDGVVRQVEGGRQEEPNVALPVDVVEAAFKEVDKLSDEPRTLLHTACLLAEPLRFDLLCEAAALPEEQVDRAVEGLLRMGVLEQTWGHEEELFRFVSPELKTRIAGELSPRLQRRAHVRIAKALEKDPSARAERAGHLAEAGHKTKALESYIVAAQAAHDFGFYEHAAWLWTLAARNLSAQEASVAGRLALMGSAETAERLGRLEEAEVALRSALANGDDSARPALVLRLAELLQRVGKVGEALEICRAELCTQKDEPEGVALAARVQELERELQDNSRKAPETVEMPPVQESAHPESRQNSLPQAAEAPEPVEAQPLEAAGNPETAEQPPEAPGPTPARPATSELYDTGPKPRSNRALLGVLGALVLVALGLGAWLVFGVPRGRLSLTSQPSGAQVLVDGKVRGLTPLALDRLKTGPHQVELSLDHYQPSRARITVARGKTTSRSFTLAPDLGQLSFQVQPAKAEVFVDGTSRGVDPGTLRLAPGTYRVELRRAGFKSYAASVTVEADRSAVVRADMLALQGHLVVTSRPDNSPVTVDGKSRGTTPLDLDDLHPGTYQVVVSRKGYATVARSVDVTADKTAAVKISLHPVAARLKLTSSPDGARVTLNGKPRGTTPAAIDDLPAGSYAVSLSLAGYRSSSSTIKLAAGDERSLKFTLRRIPAPRPAPRPVYRRPRPAPKPGPKPHPTATPRASNPWEVR